MNGDSNWKTSLRFKYQWKVSPVVFGTLKQQIIIMPWNHLCLGSQCTYTIMGTVYAKSHVHSQLQMEMENLPLESMKISPVVMWLLSC